MKTVEIKKIIDADGHWFKLISDKNTKFFVINPEIEGSEKEAFDRAMKYAKIIESGAAYEETVYKTGQPNPIDYFMAANMDEEKIKETIGIDLSKIDE